MFREILSSEHELLLIEPRITDGLLLYERPAYMNQLIPQQVRINRVLLYN